MSDLHQLHVGVAEGGKLLALKGRHKEALARYREALRLAQAARAPQLFARHYLHCVLESLEHMGAHARAVALAREAASAAANPDPSDFQRRDRAHLLERQGVNELKAGEVAAAQATLAGALALDAALPLAAQLLEWTARGLSVSPARLAEAQRRHGYFVVRADSVEAARALDPPARAQQSDPLKEAFHGR
ncbi:peptidylprolyl isomerase [Sandaracinobacteroides saxicola]|uniref:Peptidylprolyl isomerase n=1 Tax=Sandaracinobacteroides saxicola TaxID=2759707 RepID=A0A7G5IHK8_9SPHN|nr:peptidylprolyl isomerase [Sandaracinobacteroides saxicola]QMW22850.1 peptidylprolyl isomerase [Sandaracinobacteroides saxicola]